CLTRTSAARVFRKSRTGGRASRICASRKTLPRPSRAIERDDQPSDMQGKQVVAAVHAVIEERPLPEAELVASLWQGLMAQVDWSARPDQIEGLALREVSRFAPIIEPFCPGPKTEVALINTDHEGIPADLKVLYNKDCVSDQAIIYWHQKGSKPQGRQHFLKANRGLVKGTVILDRISFPPSDAPTSFCRKQEDSEEE
ncbi:hypothetical protein F5888DRAFT_1633502, partial [Russula emetica]